MWDTLEIILDHLEFSNKTTKELGEVAKSLRGKPDAAQQFIIRTHSESQVEPCNRCHSEPFCSLYLFCAYFELGERMQATALIENALDQFRKHGQAWNETLIHWLKGVYYKDTHKVLAKNELETAVEMFRTMLKSLRFNDQYNKVQTCEYLISKILQSYSRISLYHWIGLPNRTT